MSWLLKQAEDILNKVDQQTNAAIHQHNIKSTSKQTKDELISDSSSSSLNSSTKTTLNTNSTNRSTTTGNRRNNKSDDTHLIDYLNSSTPVNNKSNRPVSSNNSFNDTTRTASSPDILKNDLAKTIEQSSSKSASGTPRSITPAAQSHDEDEGLIFVRFKNKFFFIFFK
jgi:hypothetical protein